MLTRLSLSVLLLLAFYFGSITSASKDASLKEYTCPPGAEGYFTVAECTADIYYCHDGAAFPEECPCGGTPENPYPPQEGCPVFDSTVGKCVDPMECSALKTTSAPSTTTTMETTTATAIPSSTTTQPSTTPRPVTCTSDGFYPVPASCTSSFYVCIDGVASVMTCPGGAIFDPVTYKCTAYSEAACVKSFECPTQTGTNFYPYSPDACSSLYFLCVNGVALLQYCPNNAVFVPDLLTCVAPGQAPPCTPGQSHTPPTCIATDEPAPTTTTVFTDFVCPSQNGKFPYQSNCSLYWSCQDSVPTLTQCPQDTGFNPETGYCELTFLVPNCNARTYLKIRDIVNMDFACPTSFGHYPRYPHKCLSSYISCKAGIPFNKVCPGVEVFDPIETKCIAMQYSSCNNEKKS